MNVPVSPFLQVNTLTQGGQQKSIRNELITREKTLAIKHRQINASVSPFRQVNTLTQVFEMNL